MMTKRITRNIDELIDFCIGYTLYMKDHGFDEKEIKKLNKRFEKKKK